VNNIILSFDDVGLAYRRTLNPFSEKNWILNDINFELYRGEVLGVVGRNGAGKSTLLRLLADIVSPNSGFISRTPGSRSQLLTLALGFIPKLNGYDNAVISLVTQGKTISEAKKLIPEIISFSEIGHLMDHPVSTYSSGERSRLGFAIAMNATPDILLLDEMLGVGDKNFQLKSSKALKKWVNSDQTAVLVSHNPAAILESCQRVLWIENGHVKMIDEASKVIEAYNSPTK
jgi:lipopolysaccharide transport system ATP-binding protein